MSTIVLEDKSAELLKKCTTSALLHDREGNVIGYFEPGERPPIDEAELDRRSRRWQGLPHADARRELEERG